MNFELSLLNGLIVEYSFSIHVRLPPPSALGVPKAFDTRLIVEPKVESTYVPPTEGAARVSYSGASSTPVEVSCATAFPIKPVNSRHESRSPRTNLFTDFSFYGLFLRSKMARRPWALRQRAGRFQETTDELLWLETGIGPVFTGAGHKFSNWTN